MIDLEQTTGVDRNKPRITARPRILYWYTAISIQDVGGLPLGVIMAESDHRNALGQGRQQLQTSA